jgi:hypothetical protein
MPVRTRHSLPAGIENWRTVNPFGLIGRRLTAGGRRIRTCMGLFLSSRVFWFVAGSLFGAGKPFFVPSPAIRFAERAEGVKGPKR